jgi:site-specific DNA-methyltransferase (cytosine-N4-specific)
MRALLKNGYQIRRRPSNHSISAKFLVDNRGSIPSNLLGFAEPDEAGQMDLIGEPFDVLFENIIAISNTSSKDKYLEACRAHGLKPHSARFPRGLPAFFIEFLTEPGDLVYDPFAGSNTTGEMAEALNRRWVSCELDADGAFAGTYVRSSAFRFPAVKFEPGCDAIPEKKWASEGIRVRPKNISDVA